MSTKTKVQRKSTGSTPEEIVQKLKDPRPLLETVGQLLVASTQARIRTTKSDPRGSPWAPWSLATYMARARAGELSGGLLFNTGRLYNSIQYQIQGKQVIVGSDVFYAQFLQEGTPKMPARPFIGFSEGDREMIKRTAERYLLKG